MDSYQPLSDLTLWIPLGVSAPFARRCIKFSLFTLLTTMMKPELMGGSGVVRTIHTSLHSISHRPLKGSSSRGAPPFPPPFPPIWRSIVYADPLVYPLPASNTYYKKHSYMYDILYLDIYPLETRRASNRGERRIDSLPPRVL